MSHFSKEVTGADTTSRGGGQKAMLTILCKQFAFHNFKYQIVKCIFGFCQNVTTYQYSCGVSLSQSKLIRGFLVHA